MGLIKAAVGAASSTLHDQWKDAIRCENMTNDVLMVKKTSSNGVISNGSTIIVAPGQCAILYDNGRVIEATAEDGIYTFDSSSTPSFFAGQFGDVFKEMWQRFTYNGASAKQQAVFFFNTKDIINNNFGTTNPVPFQDWSHPIPNQMTGEYLPLRLEVKCHGKYTFRIANPALFMNKIAGTADIYKKDELVEQMRADVVGSFQNVLNELGTAAHKVPALELPNQTDEIKAIMDQKVFDAPIREKGLEITGFVVESVTLTDESEKKIDKYELSSNPLMQQGNLNDAYATAVVDAANNANGSANGFMGVGMMNMASSGMIGGVAQAPFTQGGAAAQNAAPVNQTAGAVAAGAAAVANAGNTWTCPNCGKTADGKFCGECGAKKPEAPAEKKCPNCGAKVDGKFCGECGTKVE